MSNTGRTKAVVGLGRLGLLLVVCALSVACNELKDWRNSQIQQSHSAASAGKLAAPAQVINVPTSLTNKLPWDPRFEVVSYSDTGGQFTLTAISPWNTLQTTKWMLTKLSQLGYDSGDNPSRILEGVEYSNPSAKISRLFVKVTLNTHKQCSIELSGSS